MTKNGVDTSARDVCFLRQAHGNPSKAMVCAIMMNKKRAHHGKHRGWLQTKPQRQH